MRGNRALGNAIPDGEQAMDTRTMPFQRPSYRTRGSAVPKQPPLLLPFLQSHPFLLEFPEPVNVGLDAGNRLVECRLERRQMLP